MLFRVYRCFRSSRDGIALLEFALILPFMLALFFGGIELARLIMVIQRVEAVTVQLANVTAQYAPATTALPESGKIHQFELTNNVFPLSRRILYPCNEADCSSRFGPTFNDPDFVAILTSIRREGTQTLVKWQLGGGGSLGGVLSRVSGLGPNNPPTPSARNAATIFTGEMAALANGMYPNENIIVAEAFYEYRPIFSSVLLYLGVNIPPFQIYRSAYVPPRNGDLVCLPPAFVYAGSCT